MHFLSCAKKLSSLLSHPEVTKVKWRTSRWLARKYWYSISSIVDAFHAANNLENNGHLLNPIPLSSTPGILESFALNL